MALRINESLETQSNDVDGEEGGGGMGEGKGGNRGRRMRGGRGRR